MKIRFEKIGTTPKDFELNLEDVTFVGTLQKTGYHRVSLDAGINGKIELDCDRCGQGFDYPLDSKLKLTLSDIVIEDKDNLDIIEFLDGDIDLTYILESEINALKGSYHYCEKCDNGDENFEIEF